MYAVYANEDDGQFRTSLANVVLIDICTTLTQAYDRLFYHGSHVRRYDRLIIDLTTGEIIR